jgi:hypothetical protein
MNAPTIVDDPHIETRFVWARCAAKNARAMRDLIRAFQSDGWTVPKEAISRKKRFKRRPQAAKRHAA